MNILDFQELKKNNQRISMVTCYDYSFAKIVANSEIDTILVGDSLAMVMHGHPNTLNANIEMMALHTAAVAKGAPQKFIVADLPFLSFRSDLTTGMNAVLKVMQAGAHAIKIEGAKGNLDFIRHCVDSGAPVMGHLGLTPQSIHQLGGFKVQGKNPESYHQLIEDAENIQKAGCFSLVLECVPAKLAMEITERLKIPTIGIGAGPYCDGQVLVLQDMLGMNNEFSPKFLRKYLDGFQLIQEALNHYHEDVLDKKFPLENESYQ